LPFAPSCAVTPRTGRRILTSIGVLASCAVLVSVLPVSNAFASGSSTTTVAQAQQQLDAVSIQADKAVEAYDEAQNSLATVTATASAAKAAAAQEQTVVDAAKVGVQALAVARYEGSTASPALEVLLSNDPTTFLQQTEVLQQVSHYQSASLTDVVNANRVMTALQASADQAVGAQQSALARLAATKAAVDKVLGQQTALLTAAQAQAAHAAAVAATAAETAAVERQRTVSRSAIRPALSATYKTTAKASAPFVAKPVAAAPKAAVPAAVVPAAASGKISKILAYAYAQLNKPYRFGGAGSRVFDCSGLVMRAAAAAGISLAHSAAAQQRSGHRVSLSALQPGDLVFWGNPAYHVGIYVGGGKILDAPHTGTVVQVQSIWGRPSSATRL
jgi:cell wall-associated NlpC family hydrolase